MSDAETAGQGCEELIASMMACVNEWQSKRGPSDAYYAALIDLKSALKRLERDAAKREDHGAFSGARQI